MKSGLLGRSPEALDAKAKRPMPTPGHAETLSHVLDLRLPDQRAVGEQLRWTMWRRMGVDDPLDPCVIVGIGVQSCARRQSCIWNDLMHASHMRWCESQAPHSAASTLFRDEIFAWLLRCEILFQRPLSGSHSASEDDCEAIVRGNVRPDDEVA